MKCTFNKESLCDIVNAIDKNIGIKIKEYDSIDDIISILSFHFNTIVMNVIEHNANMNDITYSANMIYDKKVDYDMLKVFSISSINRSVNTIDDMIEIIKSNDTFDYNIVLFTDTVNEIY